MRMCCKSWRTWFLCGQLLSIRIFHVLHSSFATGRLYLEHWITFSLLDHINLLTHPTLDVPTINLCKYLYELLVIVIRIYVYFSYKRASFVGIKFSYMQLNNRDCFIVKIEQKEKNSLKPRLRSVHWNQWPKCWF